MKTYSTRLLRYAVLALLIGAANTGLADATAHYMANEGVMVSDGSAKILFDPIYRNSYNNYLLLPADMERALFAGEPPFDNVDAVFISHSHGDHFSAADILRLMRQQTQILLFAPNQAVIEMRSEAQADDAPLFERVTAVSLEYQQAPQTYNAAGLDVGAVRIPHSGWPTGRLDIENIAWRVTLNDDVTVVHLGDADPNDVHFSRDAAYWSETATDLALPPYWFYQVERGKQILDQRLRARDSVGIHVPAAVPADPIRRPEEFRGFDLFITPGETRLIPSP